MIFVNRGQQAGFTLTELMITVTLSLTVISSVLVGYVGIHTGSVNTLSSSKLHQDLSAVMYLMTSDIRRAGFTGLTPQGNHPVINPFNAVDSTALEVFDNMVSSRQMTSTGRGSCIVYAYDSDQDGTVDAAELVGFRLNAGTVQMRTVGNLRDPDSCTSAGNTWTNLTDPDFITVSSLSFDLFNSTCVNVREPDLVDNDGNGSVDNSEEMDCYKAPLPTVGSGDITVETRQINISLAGNRATDDFVRSSQTHSVRVRNDLVRKR